MLLSAYAKLMADNNKEIVILHSEDTDVYVQAAYVSHQLQGNLLIKHKKEYIICSAMLSEDVANIIIPLHVITGTDHTSAFFGHGKKVLQKVVSDPEARELLQQVGERLELRDEVKAAIKTFVLYIMYSENAGVRPTCGQARASKWHKNEEKSTVRLPPDDDMLNHHLERTNYNILPDAL